MHITLVLSFPCSIHTRDWSLVMTELRLVTMARQVRRATVAFRDDLYADDLLTSFMEHASRWRHVLADIHHCTFGYRRNDTQPEFWDDECDTAAAFLDHRRIWLGVMVKSCSVTPSHRHTCLHYCVDVDARWRCSHYAATCNEI